MHVKVSLCSGVIGQLVLCWYENVEIGYICYVIADNFQHVGRQLERYAFVLLLGPATESLLWQFYF